MDGEVAIERRRRRSLQSMPHANHPLTLLPTAATMAITLDSVLWYGSLVVLAIAVLPLDDLLSIAIHPIIRYALGATALVVILFFMGDDADDGVVVMGANTNDAANSKIDDAREVKRERLKEEIRTKILNDAYRDVQRASADATPPSTAGDDDDGADDDTNRAGTSSVPVDEEETKHQARDSNDENKNSEEKEEDDEDEDDLGKNNKWRCACENGFLPPGLLKTFGGAEAVMRMGMGQCYHKNGA